MAKTLVELNDYLFDELSMLSNRSLQGEALQQEIERARAISKMAECIIGNGNLVLRAQELVGEYNSARDVDVPNYLLGVEEK